MIGTSRRWVVLERDHWEKMDHYKERSLGEDGL